MSYRVDRFNGSFLVTVDDGTIDTTTDLRFIGRNYAGYGEVQNENFLHLMENFANTSPPPKAVTGQIWYDSNPASKKLKFYDGAQWKVASGSAASTTAPAGLTTGDFWFDTSTDQLYAWNGTEFILVGPENTPELTATAVFANIVKDNFGTNYNILKVNVNDETQAIISGAEFTLNSNLNPIAGFSIIKKGFNLINTDPVTGVTNTDHYFWGTTSNSLRFTGRPVEDFVLQEDLGSFNDNGLTIGNQNDLRIYVENGDIPVIENQLGSENPTASIILRIRTGPGVEGAKDIAVVNASGVNPGTDINYTLGNSGARWLETHSQLFVGNLTGNVTGNTTGVHKGDLLDVDDFVRFDHQLKTFYGDFVGGTFSGVFNGPLNGTATNANAVAGLTTSENPLPSTLAVRTIDGNLRANRFEGISDRANQLLVETEYRSTSILANPNTVAARDGSGNMFAVIFNGTATSAQYADLAEKYLADKEYDVGTVVSIGGEAEVTAAEEGDRAIGVISGSPAFRMNSDLEGGTYVALKGRVPVKVVGAVNKKDRLVATDEGCARVASPGEYHNVFAVAIETSSSESIKLIEALVL